MDEQHVVIAIDIIIVYICALYWDDNLITGCPGFNLVFLIMFIPVRAKAWITPITNDGRVAGLLRCPRPGMQRRRVPWS